MGAEGEIVKREIIYTYLLLVMIAVATVTSRSFGMGSSNPTNPSKRPSVIVCSASDDGWEEHWGGHSTCGECLSKHGGCAEKCSEVSYSCKAKGTAPNGESISKEAIGIDRYQTADEALQRCQASGASNCSASAHSDCSEVYNEVSRKRCQSK